MDAVTVYLVDEDNIFKGIGTVLSNQATPDMITVAPPVYSIDRGHHARWVNGSWVIELSPAGISDLWASIRKQRDSLLAATDWTQLADVKLTNAQLTAVTAYRTALRNIPQTYPDPTTVVWPTKPI